MLTVYQRRDHASPPPPPASSLFYYVETNCVVASSTGTMAQGAAKLAAKTKSAGAQKRKAVKGKRTGAKKGQRECRPRRFSSTAQERAATTRAINRKNEASIAAKAVAVGTKFFLGDVASKGEREMQKQLRERSKKQSKRGGGVASDRLKKQLRKLGKNV